MKNYFVVLPFILILASCSSQEISSNSVPEKIESTATTPTEVDQINLDLTKIQTELNSVNESLLRAENQLAAFPKTADAKQAKKRSSLESEVKHYQFIKTNLELKKGQIESKLKMLLQSDIQPK